MTQDTTPRYLPSVLHSIDGPAVVARVTIHAPGRHPPGLAIRPDLTAVVVTLANGRTRQFGFDAAWINSELRCVVRGFDSRDEVRRTWSKPGDYGADPIGDGTFRMVPSGDVVSAEEKRKRLAR